MNIFRTTLEIESGELFLVQAINENKKVSFLTVSPVIDGVIQPYTEHSVDDLAGLVKKIEIVLDTLE